MAFGFNAAPSHFQNIMTLVLDGGEARPNHATYLDDATVGGPDIRSMWDDTLLMIRKLVSAGFPINILKCQFLVRSLTILGVVLAEDRYCLGNKALHKLFYAGLTSDLRSLQSLLGRLNFAS